ncbi:DUF1045 domain-containing protein [Tabrizicola piscis]
MKRYAVYFAPRPGEFADRAAGWLSGGVALPGLPRPAAEITGDPRRYGFHGTLRAPFRPAEGMDQRRIEGTVGDLARRLAPVSCEGLRLENLHGFLALTPVGCEAAMLEFGAMVVEGTDTLRAPLTEAEIARRRPERLTSRQRALLQVWGYPHVMEEFRFHLTLTDRLPEAEVAPVMAALDRYFTPVLPRPFLIEDLCLFGEDDAGFHLLHRYALTG